MAEQNWRQVIKTIAVIQARMGSSRLPGKVMIEVAGKPLIGWQIDRVRLATSVDQIVVATSTSPENDQLASFCAEQGVTVFRGSEDDVLSRISGYAALEPESLMIELFGDSPLIDFRVIEQCVQNYNDAGDSHTVSLNTLDRTFPGGMACLAYKASALLLLDSLVDPLDPLREHVGYNFRRFPKHFKLKSFRAGTKQHAPELHFEVDEEVDLMLISRLLGELPGNSSEIGFSVSEMIKYCRANKEIGLSNSKVERRYKKLDSQ